MSDEKNAARGSSGIAAKARELLLRASGQWTAQTKWDTQHARGQWDYLTELGERARYSVLAGYAHALKPGGRLLDVGCGAGILRERLHPDAYSQFVGIDFGEAIARAAHLVGDRTTFVAADMHDYDPGQRFDLIVFNESFYYFRDPAAGVRRYEDFLEPDGFFLTSMHLSAKPEEAWRSMSNRYEIVDEVLVANRDGTSWICRAIRPQG